MAHLISSKGKWIPGVIDPNTAESRNNVDGRRNIDLYMDLGLDLTPAINSVEAGIATTYQMLAAGNLKVMPHCVNWFSEMHRYHREEDGTIKQQDDHELDATRYGVM